MINWENKKLGSMLDLILVGIIIILINFFSGHWFFQLDLTEEKRYTLSEATHNLLDQLNDNIYVEVYLAGELNADFTRFQKAIREKLEDYQRVSKAKVKFSFIDPAQAKSKRAQNEYFNYLAEMGITPTNLFDTKNGQRIEKLIFPGAIIAYGAEEVGVMLLKGNQRASAIERLNQSIEGLEYEITSAMAQLVHSEPKQIGVILDKNLNDSTAFSSIKKDLPGYQINYIRANELLAKEPDALIIAKPKTQFTEQELFQIDQYMVRGGSALFFVDAMGVNMDSAGNAGTIAFDYQLGLDELLFKDGARINKDLIQDLNAGTYPVVTGRFGDKSQIQMLPWPFFPIINRFGKHPTVRNLDAVYTQFVSSIDTVQANGIKKTPLLYTSPYSRKLTSPIKVSLNDLRGLNQKQFNAGPVPVAYLLEGSFQSAFKTGLLPDGVPSDNFVEQSRPGKLLVCADGDFIRNEIDLESSQALPIGFEPYTKTTFANKEFIENAMAYLINDQGIILARNKEIVIRPLDKQKVQGDGWKWQTLNILVPILFIGLFGVFWIWKRRYSNRKTLKL